ncbi:MAG: LysR family transcriptional regulator [Verrucomicrobiales bacterium]|nr:LysR family transcriptional regulator [Verrucomicrobiota bacterium JB022]
MEFQQIRYFLAVAELHNFTRAAERCNVAQPSLSQQIKKLENELGGPLFHRLGRKVVLTEQGELLEPSARRILLEHDNAIDRLGDSFSRGGTVAFGATLTIAPYLIPGLLEKIGNERVLELRIEENFTEKLLEKVRAGTLDFAIMSSPVDEPDLLVKVIGKESFVAVMPRGHRLMDQQEVGLSDILAEPFLELSHIHCAGQQINEICNMNAGVKNTVFLSSQIETIRRLVREKQGVTILPRMAVRSADDELGVKEISGAKLEREITLVQHPDRYLTKSARGLIELLEEFALDYTAE